MLNEDLTNILIPECQTLQYQSGMGELSAIKTKNYFKANNNLTITLL